jgi:hypothetical protein
MKELRAGVAGVGFIVGFIGAVHSEQLRRLGNVKAAAPSKSLDPEKKAEQPEGKAR